MDETNKINPMHYAPGTASKFLIVSPVNYEAWQNGYQPPTDHRLIHNLMYEQAHVISSLELDGFGFWIVARGKLSGKRGTAFKAILERHLEDALEALIVDDETTSPSPPSSDGIERPNPSGEVAGSTPAADATPATQHI